MPADAQLPPLRNVVAILHVASVARAATFYAQLGLQIANTHHEPGRDGDEPVWAWLQSQHGGSLMLARADAPVDPAVQYPRDHDGSVMDTFFPEQGKTAEAEHGRIPWLHLGPRVPPTRFYARYATYED